MGVSIVMEVPKVRWLGFVRENPKIRMMTGGSPMTWETTMCINVYNSNFTCIVMLSDVFRV